MTDAETGLAEQMYCSQQIIVPLNLPYILKQYAKAAIRTQPSDLLYWSAVYFRALADGTTPPVKDRIEYPPITSPSGLSPGFLKVLIKQFGKKVVVRESDIEEKWLGVGLKPSALHDLFRLTANEKDMVRWLNFVAVAAGHLCPSLTQTMILICELLTDDPEGGPATISLDIFLPLYKFLARLNCGPVIKSEDSPDISNFKEICGTRQHSLTSLVVSDEHKDVGEVKESLQEPPKEIEERYDSDAGIPVWQDLKLCDYNAVSSPHPSEEGMTSEKGLVVFDRINEDFTTPGYVPPGTQPSPSPQKEQKKPSSDQKKPKTPIQKPSGADHATKLSVDVFDGVEVPVCKVTKADTPAVEKLVQDFVEEQKDSKGEGADDEDEDEDAGEVKVVEEKDSSTVSVGKAASSGDQHVSKSEEMTEEMQVQEELKKQFEEEKRIKDEQKAEKRRLKDEERAEKKRIKEKKKEEKLDAKAEEREELKDGEKKRRRKKKKKKILDESGQVIGESEDEEEEEDDFDFSDDLINEEDLEDESTTASSSISIDPDLEVISSSQILGEDEVWEEIVVEEESLDDEENKIIRKVKKRVKKKVPKKLDNEAKKLRPIDKDMEAKGVTESKRDLGMKLQKELDSIEGIKGKQKDQVRVSGMFNLHPDMDDISSLLSEPELIDHSFVHVPGIGPIVSERQIKVVVRYMTDWASKQGGYVMPRNIRHFLCPPLDAECNQTEFKDVSPPSSPQVEKQKKPFELVH